MKQLLSDLSFKTAGEGFTDITTSINEWISRNSISQGILLITTKHTSCSLVINENADPDVLSDLSSFMHSLVPEEGFTSRDGKGQFTKYLHSDEGIDDMPAHIKTALTTSNINLSIDNGKLVLGTWQAVYLWEHRYAENIRKIHLHAIGV